jgi:hypothetical protein
MPRNCGCSGNACSCLVTAGPGLQVEGTGNSSAPYVISLAPNQGAFDAGQIPAGGTLDTRDLVVDSVVRVEALGAMFIRPPDAFGVKVDYYIVNSESALITILGTVQWQPAPAPTLNSPTMWIHMVNVLGATRWVARGAALTL